MKTLEVKLFTAIFFRREYRKIKVNMKWLLDFFRRKWKRDLENLKILTGLGRFVKVFQNTKRHNCADSRKRAKLRKL